MYTAELQCGDWGMIVDNIFRGIQKIGIKCRGGFTFYISLRGFYTVLFIPLFCRPRAICGRLWKAAWLHNVDNILQKDIKSEVKLSANVVMIIECILFYFPNQISSIFFARNLARQFSPWLLKVRDREGYRATWSWKVLWPEPDPGSPSSLLSLSRLCLTNKGDNSQNFFSFICHHKIILDSTLKREQTMWGLRPNQPVHLNNRRHGWNLSTASSRAELVAQQSSKGLTRFGFWGHSWSVLNLNRGHDQFLKFGGAPIIWCNVSPSPTYVSLTENSWMLHPLDKVSLGYFAPDRTISSLCFDWAKRHPTSNCRAL